MMVIGLGISGAASAAGHDEADAKAAAAAETAAIALPLSSTYEPQLTRPAVLPALYATLGAMQAWDYYSTSSALKAGAREANPTTAAFVGSKGSLLGLKLATTASTIFFAERAWKKNRLAAVVMMTAINGATAAVAVHNMRNARLASTR
jgi:uncharacterized membrane protein (UPF0136 family)